MFFVYDPIGSLFVVVGIVIYHAFKSLGEVRPAASVSVKPKTKEEEWAEEVRRRERIIQLVERGLISKYSTDDYQRYVIWLSDHQNGVRLPTPDEQHAEWLRQIEENRVKKEDKRLYEWWLFKHSDEYEKEMARLEAYLNR